VGHDHEDALVVLEKLSPLVLLSRVDDVGGGRDGEIVAGHGEGEVLECVLGDRAVAHILGAVEVGGGSLREGGGKHRLKQAKDVVRHPEEGTVDEKGLGGPGVQVGVVIVDYSLEVETPALEDAVVHVWDRWGEEASDGLLHRDDVVAELYLGGGVQSISHSNSG